MSRTEALPDFVARKKLLQKKLEKSAAIQKTQRKQVKYPKQQIYPTKQIQPKLKLMIAEGTADRCRSAVGKRPGQQDHCLFYRTGQSCIPSKRDPAKAYLKYRFLMQKQNKEQRMTTFVQQYCDDTSSDDTGSVKKYRKKEAET